MKMKKGTENKQREMKDNEREMKTMKTIQRYVWQRVKITARIPIEIDDGTTEIWGGKREPKVDNGKCKGNER